MNDTPDRELWSAHSVGMAGARPYIAQVREDAAFHGFVAGYTVVGFVISIAAGVPHKFAPLTYAAMVMLGLLSPVALVLACMGLSALGSPTPLQTLRAGLKKMLIGPRAAASLVLFASLLVFMGVFTSLKSMLPDLVPFFADLHLADLDRSLHGRDPWLLTVAWLPAQLTPALETAYFGLWGLLLTGSLLAALWVPGLRPVRSQFIWTTLIIWTLLGNVVAGAAMSAGPVFYDRIVGDPVRFSGLLAYLAEHSAMQEWGHAYLWKHHVSGEVGAGTAISAFPSLHVAVATLNVLLARHIHRGVMWGAVAFAVVILFGSVHLGWHYAVDGYFSMAATVLIWVLVGHFLATGNRKIA